MTSQIVHDMDTAWVAAPPPALQAALDTLTPFGIGAGSNRLTGQSGSAATAVTFTPAVPVNLSAFDEVRFWLRANRAAHGTARAPFYLEFTYTDAGDLPGEEHLWFVPVNRAATWEQRRIGFENDRRSAITQFQFRAIGDTTFTCNVDELLAVREEMLTDLEQVMLEQVDGTITLPGLTGIALDQPASAGATQVILPLTPGFAVDNRVLISGGAVPDQEHAVTGVNHDTAANTTTLTLDPPLAGARPAGTSTVTLLIPVIFEAPPTPTVQPSPALLVTFLGAREDLERTGYYTQRDSFRPRGSVVVCSTRPAARAYLADYQLNAIAPDRAQQRIIQTECLRRFSMDLGLRINGYPSPVQAVAPPDLDERRLGELAPVYVRFGTRMETAARQEQTWVQQADITAGRIDAPRGELSEVITLEFTTPDS